MSKSNMSKSTLIGSALAATLLLGQVPQANAESGLFNVMDLDRGYATTVGDHKKEEDAEGKCGEGKCGGDKDDKDAEGKCGEGKCGGDSEEKDAEGKCGEGKCGTA